MLLLLPAVPLAVPPAAAELVLLPAAALFELGLVYKLEPEHKPALVNIQAAAVLAGYKPAAEELAG